MQIKLSLTLHLLFLPCLLQWNLEECTVTPSAESYYPYFDYENTKKICYKNSEIVNHSLVTCLTITEVCYQNCVPFHH